ncbi:uncharacterized protein LY79DRAFT_674262 [Colletotrichum navitas]|uniref:Uncharacterized protein n=1 Tax=Colletotrichum navitas TaxID=681940 RepID=A0AAD8UZR5_9PEZI|nr:uncharacterized protein LY79DRAFT_674262 [Colletotrichum navitas]KAK1570064.1 hypothetical protein LY79DRAFT_674262 [Colletotrichum navitas]
MSIKLEIQPQNFEPGAPECHYRRYHLRHLHLHDPEALPDLPFDDPLQDARHEFSAAIIDQEKLL